MGTPGGSRSPGRFATRRPRGRGAARSGAHRTPRFHLSGPKGLALWRVARPADVPRALGDRPAPAGPRRRRAPGFVELAPMSVPKPRSAGSNIRFIPARGGRARPDPAPVSGRSLLVVLTRDGT